MEKTRMGTAAAFMMLIVLILVYALALELAK